MRKNDGTGFSQCKASSRGHRSWIQSVPPLALVVYALVSVCPMMAQNSLPSDYQVKAIYLYNFARFVEWPAKTTRDQGSFTICILGQDPFGAALDAALAGETVAGRIVTAKRISNPEESENCRILFMSSAEGNSLNKIIDEVKKHAVLTVSDMPQFASHGGMIQFVLEGRKIRFEVNLTAAQNAGLTLSSELLKVATAVRKPPAAGD